MLYRVSQRTLFRNINTNLGFLTWDMAKINNQIATGKKVNKPSDDPTGGSLILAMRTVLADVGQYNKDVALADDWLNQTESIALNMKLLIERANVLAEQMSTDTYQPDNMDVAAGEVGQLLDSLINLGNTRIGDRYIFAGQKTEIRPFSLDMEILDPRIDPGNASSYTGLVKPPDDRTYVPRPDIAVETHTYLAEVTTAGGVNGNSLAELTLDQEGAHNGLAFTAQAPTYSGTAGNGIQVIYDDSVVPNVTTYARATAANQITVYLSTDAAGTVTATAQDVMTAVNNDTVNIGFGLPSDYVSANLLEGNSGTGLVAATGAPASSLSGGVDGGALFRVSVDGGLTWGVVDAFPASDSLTPDIIYNNQLGHATLSTNFPNTDQNIQFTAGRLGTSGNDVAVEYVFNGGGTLVSQDLATNTVTVDIPLAGTTAQAVVDFINNPINGIDLVTAGVADYRIGGAGALTAAEVMAPTYLSGADPDITALGHATLTTQTTFSHPDPNPNVQFTAVAHGTPGNALEIEYVNTPGYGPPTDVTVAGNVITVNLETDAGGAVLATAQDVVRAVNSDAVARTMVTANLADWPNGGGIVSPMSPTSLSGGDPTVDIANHGGQIRFEGDGSTLTVGDRFEVDVHYYHGDDQDIDVNANQGVRVKINVTGEEALGEVGAFDNVLDTLSRLKFALEQHDTVMVADELPRLGDCLDKLTTQMAKVGVRMMRNQFTYNVLDATEESATERTSRVEDLDIADAVTNLQTKQTAYQATLAATSLITRLSLVDYIR